MLDSLDTLIAFVLIMLVISLLITIVVQMTGAALLGSGNRGEVAFHVTTNGYLINSYDCAKVI
jgi:hypothetical protein